METLTNIPLNDWTVIVDEEEYAPDAEQLRQVITISPHEYRETEEEESIENEEELNEMRVSAGIPVKSIYNANDAEMKAFKALAGL